MRVHAVASDELTDWDRAVVDAPGGHVYQSRAWAAHRANAGWRPRFLRFDDGFGVLVLERPWHWIGGAGAYVPRGPIAAGEPVERTAERLGLVSDHLARDGVDVLASDAEIPTESGYGALLATIGFHPIPEIQPSRHRMSLALGPDTDDEAIRTGFAKATRQRISAAERDGPAVARYDRGGWAGDGILFGAPLRPIEEAFETFYAMLEATGDRRGFSFGPRARFVPWWQAAHEAGMLVYLEANDAAGDPLAGLVLYRHGERLTTVHSADRAGAREEHPGVMHLLRWRAIQLAVREDRREMDLGGVDVGPEHRLPHEGEPMYGLYEHKRSFGASWVEMTGAHERVTRGWRYGLGRLTGRLARGGPR